MRFRDIFHQVEKFKKNVKNSLKKLTENIEEESLMQEKKIAASDEEYPENFQEEGTKKLTHKKAKNVKIPI